jgi:hypothetical protein
MCVCVCLLGVCRVWLAVVPLMAIFFALGYFYRYSARELKRLDNTTRSPVFAHLSESMQAPPLVHCL